MQLFSETRLPRGTVTLGVLLSVQSCAVPSLNLEPPLVLLPRNLERLCCNLPRMLVPKSPMLLCLRVCYLLSPTHPVPPPPSAPAGVRVLLPDAQGPAQRAVLRVPRHGGPGGHGGRHPAGAGADRAGAARGQPQPDRGHQEDHAAPRLPRPVRRSRDRTHQERRGEGGASCDGAAKLFRFAKENFKSSCHSS